MGDGMEDFKRAMDIWLGLPVPTALAPYWKEIPPGRVMHKVIHHDLSTGRYTVGFMGLGDNDESGHWIYMGVGETFLAACLDALEN